MELHPRVKPHLSEIERIMQDELGKEEPRIYGMLAPFLKRGGKRIRPALCLLSCGAVGGKYEDVLQPAAIIELFHNFTLVHDDIEDDSQFRRGEPTLHVSYGIPIALNSGDALYTLLWNKLVSLRLPPSRLVKLEQLYAASFKRVVDGQGLELAWIKEGRFDVSEEDYLAMIYGKTSALMGLSCEAGAMIAGGGKRLRSALRDYGEKIGAAFQIQDDVLNLTGDFEKYKKEIGGDITEGKRTFMVVHCLARAGEKDKQRLTAILSSHSKEKADIDEAVGILKASGSIDYARKKAEKLVKDAKKRIGSLKDGDDKTNLLAIADYVVNREA
ncbi:polyprenyl synthetase family protein [Candidatus Micrarchaeota archaeon]|nr:polyprenyl synthetase family protein [Candidatus Micrarchaeota archaeon]